MQRRLRPIPAMAMAMGAATAGMMSAMAASMIATVTMMGGMAIAAMIGIGIMPAMTIATGIAAGIGTAANGAVIMTGAIIATFVVSMSMTGTGPIPAIAAIMPIAIIAAATPQSG